MVKVDEEVRKELVENLREWLRWLSRGLEEYMEEIGRAETVEEIMSAKKDLLVFYFNNAPMYSGECYFCILHAGEEYCDECEYAKYHGRCDDDGSDWQRIRGKVMELVRLVDENYYKGERYGGEVDGVDDDSG